MPGTCNQRQCQCDGPSATGLFAGIQMVQGADCSQLRTQDQVSRCCSCALHGLLASDQMTNGLQSALYAITAFTGAIAVFSSVYYAVCAFC